MPHSGHCGHTSQQLGWQGRWENCCQGMCINTNVAQNCAGHGNLHCGGSMQPSSGGGNGVCETSAQGFARHQAASIATNGGMPQMQGIGVEEPLSPSQAVIRAQQRSLKRTLEIEIAEQRQKGLPPHQVEVTKNGKIDGACAGKNIWDDKIRGFAPHHLNMAIVKVGEQNVVDMAELRRVMDTKFVYLHHELSDQGFRDYVRRFMKFERSRLKKRWIMHGHTTCPMGVETSQWDTLVAYWYERATKKRTDQLTGARGAVMKVSKYGQSGKAMAKHKLVTHCLQPTMFWDVWCNG